MTSIVLDLWDFTYPWYLENEHIIVTSSVTWIGEKENPIFVHSIFITRPRPQYQADFLYNRSEFYHERYERVLRRVFSFSPSINYGFFTRPRTTASLLIVYLFLYEVKVSVYVRIVGNVDGSRIGIIEEAESDRDVLGNDRQWGHFAAERDRQEDGVRAGVPHVDLNHRVTDARDISRVNHLRR